LAKDNLCNPRWLAVKTLLMVLRDGKSLDAASEIILSDAAGCDARDLPLYQELIRGSCRWFLALRQILTPYLRKPFKAKDLDLEIIMIIGLYQILLMRIDDHAAVNESVKLVHQLKKDWSRGLVNAVLRQVIRDGINIEPARYLDSYPQWIQKKLAQDWPHQFREIAQAGNNRAPLTLRVDLRRKSTKAIIEILLEQHINASLHGVIDSAITLEKPCDVTKLEVFNSGLVSVQDAAAQLAAGLLDCKSGMRVLDACAAPGGKTAHLLQYSDELDVVALDIDALRLTRIEQNLARIGQQAMLVCGDAANPGDWYDGAKFDRILADVPCSGSGVMRRHPDIKLLRRDSDIPQLVSHQRQILSALWPLLKSGGLLLYSTCSIFKDENERQIEWFVENHDNCAEKSLKSVQWGSECSFGRQILPGEHNMDGFYYACLQKVMADDI